MLEKLWVVGDQDERSAVDERQGGQASEVGELEPANAENQRRHDEMRAQRRHIRAALGLVTSFGRR